MYSFLLEKKKKLIISVISELWRHSVRANPSTFARIFYDFSMTCMTIAKFPFLLSVTHGTQPTA